MPVRGASKHALVHRQPGRCFRNPSCAARARPRLSRHDVQGPGAGSSPDAAPCRQHPARPRPRDLGTLVCQRTAAAAVPRSSRVSPDNKHDESDNNNTSILRSMVTGTWSGPRTEYGSSRTHERTWGDTFHEAQFCFGCPLLLLAHRHCRSQLSSVPCSVRYLGSGSFMC